MNGMGRTSLPALRVRRVLTMFRTKFQSMMLQVQAIEEGSGDIYRVRGDQKIPKDKGGYSKGKRKSSLGSVTLNG